jgi:hypothetical protein
MLITKQIKSDTHLKKPPNGSSVCTSLTNHFVLEPSSLEQKVVEDIWEEEILQVRKT